MKALILTSLILAALAGRQGTRTFTGIVTDSMCARADHSQMRMGATDAECTIACILAHGSIYVLYDGENAYTLSDQEKPEKFAGQRVRVTGRLDAAARTIEMVSIAAAD